MSEPKPKYEVNTIVLVDQGDMHWVARILEVKEETLVLTELLDPNDDWNGNEVHSKSYCTPVKIIPITNKPYCKNCKNCQIRQFNPEVDDTEGLHISFNGCPIKDWFESVWFVDDDFYRYGGYICDIDALQPPCNCCFVSKESK